ncbi:hypothetical protein BDZ91DRAFT_301583 [Kalaharituber pfeilii]|nr:hypothetical protein BDZ91DRAFT_301583 [Kalaharituber pfeilii]
MIGNIAIAPETQVGASGTPFVKYTIATHNGPRDAIRTSFWRVAVFEERQKQIVETLGKGSLVFVEADVELKPYESEDGKKHQYVSLFQSEFPLPLHWYRGLFQLDATRNFFHSVGCTNHPSSLRPC